MSPNYLKVSIPFLGFMLLSLPLAVSLTNATLTQLVVDSTGYMYLQPTMSAYMSQLLAFAFIASIAILPVSGFVLARTRAFQLKNWHIALLLGVWVFFFGGAAVLGGLFGGVTQQVTTPGMPGQPAADRPTYNLGFTYQETNAKSQASLSTTSPSYCVYSSKGARLTSLSTLYGEACTSIASGTTATNVKVDKTDGDFLFLNIDTGTAEFPVPASILKENPFLTGCKWLPTTNANNPELVCEIQISKVGTPNYNVDPSLRQLLKVQGIPDDLAATLSSPADQTSIGTTAGTDVYVTWEITNLAENQAFVFDYMRIATNQSSTLGQIVDLIDVTITAPAGLVDMKTSTSWGTTKFLTGGDINIIATNGTAITTWNFIPSDGNKATYISNGLLVARGSSDTDSIQIRAHLRTSFLASGNAVHTTLSFRLLNAANTPQTIVQDLMNLRA